MAKPTDSEPNKSSNYYLKYSGIGIQMAAIIVAGAMLGRYLDSSWGTDPWLTALFSLGAVFIALYVSLKDFL